MATSMESALWEKLVNERPFIVGPLPDKSVFQEAEATQVIPPPAISQQNGFPQVQSTGTSSSSPPAKHAKQQQAGKAQWCILLSDTSLNALKNMPPVQSAPLLKHLDLMRVGFLFPDNEKTQVTLKDVISSKVGDFHIVWIVDIDERRTVLRVLIITPTVELASRVETAVKELKAELDDDILSSWTLIAVETPTVELNVAESELTEYPAQFLPVVQPSRPTYRGMLGALRKIDIPVEECSLWRFHTVLSFEPLVAQIALSATQHSIASAETSLCVQGRSGTGKTTVLVARMWLLAKDSQTVLFVTKSKLLVQAVRKELVATGINVGSSVHNIVPSVPLVITWNDLLAQVLYPPHSACLNTERQVDFSFFREVVWKLLGNKVHVLDPNLVWSEFMTLQGQARKTSALTGAAFHPKDSQAVLAAYKTYTEYKKKKMLYDENDIVLALKRALVERSRLQNAFEHVLIDEAQDFTPLALEVLMTMCSNPNGLLLAGDTCQTINPGCAFCFRDVCDMIDRQTQLVAANQILHNTKLGGDGDEEEETPKPTEEPKENGHITDKDTQVDEKTDEQEQEQEAENSTTRRERMLTLGVNYRSQPGIIRIANTLVDLLQTHFPASVDVLELEEAVGRTVLPVYVSCENKTPVALLRDHSLPKDKLVILIRNNQKREELRRAGLNGTMLTVHEAKGLEYEFVVIIDFWKDCDRKEAGQLWNLTNTDSNGKMQQMIDSHKKGKVKAGTNKKERKDAYKALGVVGEMKELYTAITRARTGCVMLESAGHRARHIVGYWETQPVVSKREDTLESLLGDVLTIKPEPASWTRLRALGQRGYNLLQHALDEPLHRWPVFHEAGDVFAESAGIVTELGNVNEGDNRSAEQIEEDEVRCQLACAAIDGWTKLCRAHHTLARIQLARKVSHKVIRNEAKHAAGDFLAVGDTKFAGIAFKMAEQWKEAAHCSLLANDIRSAVDLFIAAGSMWAAAVCAIRCGQVARAMQCLISMNVKNMELLTLMVEALEHWSEQEKKELIDIAAYTHALCISLIKTLTKSGDDIVPPVSTSPIVDNIIKLIRRCDSVLPIRSAHGGGSHPTSLSDYPPVALLHVHTSGAIRDAVVNTIKSLHDCIDTKDATLTNTLLPFLLTYYSQVIPSGGLGQFIPVHELALLGLTEKGWVNDKKQPTPAMALFAYCVLSRYNRDTASGHLEECRLAFVRLLFENEVIQGHTDLRAISQKMDKLASFRLTEDLETVGDNCVAKYPDKNALVDCASPDLAYLTSTEPDVVEQQIAECFQLNIEECSSAANALLDKLDEIETHREHLEKATENRHNTAQLANITCKVDLLRTCAINGTAAQRNVSRNEIEKAADNGSITLLWLDELFDTLHKCARQWPAHLNVVYASWKRASDDMLVAVKDIAELGCEQIYGEPLQICSLTEQYCRAMAQFEYLRKVHQEIITLYNLFNSGVGYQERSLFRMQAEELLSQLDQLNSLLIMTKNIRNLSYRVYGTHNNNTLFLGLHGHTSYEQQRAEESIQRVQGGSGGKQCKQHAHNVMYHVCKLISILNAPSIKHTAIVENSKDKWSTVCNLVHDLCGHPEISVVSDVLQRTLMRALCCICEEPSMFMSINASEEGEINAKRAVPPLTILWKAICSKAGRSLPIHQYHCSPDTVFSAFMQFIASFTTEE